MLDGKRVIILGAGLSGLSAAHSLVSQDVACEVIERHGEVGGLARTLRRKGYRFDYGGYRFIGSSSEVQKLFRKLLGPDLLSVTATSKIFFRGRLYEYPLNPKDLVLGLDGQDAAIALWSYAGSRLARLNPFREPPRTLEEWLLDEFGETLFRAFFRDYNEKVWGIPCHRLSAELASRRIRGVNFAKSVAKDLLGKRLERFRSRHRFLYPRFGIGQLSTELARAIEERSVLRRESAVTEVRVRRGRVECVLCKDSEGKIHEVTGTNVISSIPLPRLLYLLNPRPPADVLAAARGLCFRDMISVCLEIRREQVMQDSWLYVPEPAIGFARVLEPRNWSDAMSPPGRTSLVCEFYCFEGDKLWACTDEELVRRTVEDLVTRLRLVSREEVVRGEVLRIRKPYPVYELGYHEHLTRIHRYLKSIVNLQAIGRGGMFKYYNVGHLVESGIRASENVFGAGHDLLGLDGDNLPRPGLFRA